LTGLTIAVCTRDRPADLERCVRCVVAAESPDDVPVELLIVDDGALPETMVPQLEQVVRARGYAFNYVRQEERHGLIHGRVAALRNAVSEVVLFLDDDVEVEPDYLKLLALRYRELPEAAGVGGVDMLIRPLAPLGALFARVFLLDSGDPGRLSPSGFSWSMIRWGLQRAPFRTEVLSGCNMSFRRKALRTLTAVPWLEGYGLGEDIYLSLVATSYGPLWIDPTLRVRHHRAARRRMAGDALAYVTIVNPYHLLRVRKARWWSYAALLWTILGLVLKDVLRPDHWGTLPGLFRAVWYVIGDLSTTRRSGDIDAERHR
jgi:glycosyltransferase involved in cell wall biosynthesis